MSLLASSFVQADDEISEIVVSATRLEKTKESVSASISVVSGDAIQRARQQLALDEALAVVPGVFFQNRYNFAQDLRIAIRGFGARSNFGVRGIKIIVDGIPETLADGQSQLDSIDIGSIRQVEVLRGPASALYGNAAGGVINIGYERATTEPYIQARIAAGDFGYRKNQIKAGGAIGRVAYDVSLSDLRVDGYREHSEAEDTQFSGRFNVELDAVSSLDISIGATDQPLSNDPGGVTLADATQDPRAARDRNVTFDAGESLEQQKLGLRYRRTLQNGAELMLRNYFLSRDFENRLPFSGGGAVTFDRHYAGGGASYVQGVDVGSLEHRFIFGIDYDRQRDDRQRFDNNDGVRGDLTLNQVERVTSTGIFFQDEIQLTETLQVTVGLRYDDIQFDVDDAFLGNGDDSGRRRLSDWSPSVGFVYKANAAHSVYGNIATAFETPTTTEFARSDGLGGFNQSLEPQKSISHEIGLRGSLGERVNYELAAFTIDVDDELLPFEIPSNPGRDFFTNAGSSDRRGIELALNLEPLDGLRIAMAYTLSRFEFDRFVDANGSDFSGNSIPGIPESYAYADISYTHESGVFAAVDVLYVDEMFANNANSATVDGSTVSNFRLGLQRDFGRLHISPFVGINNLTDTTYTSNTRINAFGGRYYEAGPERNVYAGLVLRYHFSHH